MPATNDFWRKHTAEELAAAQGVTPADDLDALIGQGSDRWGSDEEFEAFVEEIYQRRAQGQESPPEEKSGAA